MEMNSEDKAHEEQEKVECLARSIKEVEMAKSQEPAMYNKAVEFLKKEVKAIDSLQALKDVAKSKMSEESQESEEEEE